MSSSLEMIKRKHKERHLTGFFSVFVHIRPRSVLNINKIESVKWLNLVDKMTLLYSSASISKQEGSKADEHRQFHFLPPKCHWWPSINRIPVTSRPIDPSSNYSCSMHLSTLLSANQLSLFQNFGTIMAVRGRIVLLSGISSDFPKYVGKCFHNMSRNGPGCAAAVGSYIRETAKINIHDYSH